MDYSIPIPITQHDYYQNDYDCICKYCNNPEKYLTEYDGYSYLWNKCLLCHKKYGIITKFVVYMEKEVHI